MAIKRIFIFIAITIAIIECKIYTRCDLTKELLKNNFPRTFISNWVCMIENESERNTAALNIKPPNKKYYGLFQIGSEYCQEGRKGGKCDIACEALLNEDVTDDSVCARKIFDQEGFKYWSKWVTRCKGKPLPDVHKCPGWLSA